MRARLLLAVLIVFGAAIPVAAQYVGGGSVGASAANGIPTNGGGVIQRVLGYTAGLQLFGGQSTGIDESYVYLSPGFMSISNATATGAATIEAGAWDTVTDGWAYTQITGHGVSSSATSNGESIGGSSGVYMFALTHTRPHYIHWDNQDTAGLVIGREDQSDPSMWFGDSNRTCIGACTAEPTTAALEVRGNELVSGLTTSTTQTCNCGTAGTPNTVTCDISANVVYLTDGDADACTVTLSETTAAALNLDVTQVLIQVISTGGGGAFNIAESAGVVDLEAGAAWAGDAVGDNLRVNYNANGSIDQFYEIGRNNGL